MRAKKLLFDEACEIKALLWNGVSQGDIARHYAISQTSVSRIRLGQAWRDARWPDGSDDPEHVEEDPEEEDAPLALEGRDYAREQNEHHGGDEQSHRDVGADGGSERQQGNTRAGF